MAFIYKGLQIDGGVYSTVYILISHLQLIQNPTFHTKDKHKFEMDLCNRVK